MPPPAQPPPEASAAAQQAAAADLAVAQLEAGHPVTVVARGGSMRPLIRDGDALRLAPCDGAVPVGAVVLLRGPDGGFGVIHRVIARWGGRLWVKGDALPQPDGWFPPAAVLAQVVAVRRGGRQWAPARRRGVLISLSLGLLRGRLPRQPRR